MRNINLAFTDYTAISRLLDTNRNNIIEPSEATISKKSYKKIGNGNKKLGTREVAISLSKGDVFIQKVSKPAADNVSKYLSDRKNNIGKDLISFTHDGWISKDDLEMPNEMRKVVDTNKDNRISSKEFTDALTSGQISISDTIDLKPLQRNSIYDPFSNTMTNVMDTQTTTLGEIVYTSVSELIDEGI